ncbi:MULTISPECIES: hypothetical protein [unclassified Leucobacter]|uniref:hypothetical protein n=1 Tax=unclassified Leucobacter TaxID=2621730 RepID=UPI00165E131D|nr:MULTISPECIES: hypothetical protein [unclassified Leucobacter]MBC9935504.1 hypothetical protein [Leucobacter sp. cx-87]
MNLAYFIANSTSDKIRSIIRESEMEVEVAESGRPCNVCRSFKRVEIEDAIYSNTPISQISQRFAVSSHSLYRHIKNHAAPAMQDSFKASIRMNPVSISERMLDIADSARKIRRDTTNEAAALRAGLAELQVLQTLASRMGVTHESLLDSFKDASVLATVVGELARQRPVFGELMVEALANRGADEMASAISLTLIQDNHLEPLECVGVTQSLKQGGELGSCE